MELVMAAALEEAMALAKELASAMARVQKLAAVSEAPMALGLA